MAELNDGADNFRRLFLHHVAVNFGVLGLKNGAQRLQNKRHIGAGHKHTAVLIARLDIFLVVPNKSSASHAIKVTKEQTLGLLKDLRVANVCLFAELVGAEVLGDELGVAGLNSSDDSLASASPVWWHFQAHIAKNDVQSLDGAGFVNQIEDVSYDEGA